MTHDQAHEILEEAVRRGVFASMVREWSPGAECGVQFFQQGAWVLQKNADAARVAIDLALAEQRIHDLATTDVTIALQRAFAAEQQRDALVLKLETVRDLAVRVQRDPSFGDVGRGVAGSVLALVPETETPPSPDPLAAAVTKIRRMYRSGQEHTKQMRERLEAEGLEPGETTEWDDYAALKNQQTALAVALRELGSPAEIRAEVAALVPGAEGVDKPLE